MKLPSLLLMTLLALHLAALSQETGSMRGFLYGTEPACEYDHWVSHVVEGIGLSNVYSPWGTQNSNFGTYRLPSPEELLKWDNVIRHWLLEDFGAAEALLEAYEFPYDVVEFQDTDSGRLFYMLRERLNADVDTNGFDDETRWQVGSFDFGWGLYIFNPQASRQMIITAPHPCDDFPSPVIGLEALLAWDARFLFIAGASRAALLAPPAYNNDHSLSDPSRVADHAFNVAYQQACDQLRNILGHSEFSVQMHTYDLTHQNSLPVLLSAGKERKYPSLPLIDYSRKQLDIFHKTPAVVIPQGVAGAPEPITRSQYYSLYYDPYNPPSFELEGQDFTPALNSSLPGSALNQQMLYTVQQNLWDGFSPFLHVEMAELPGFLPRTQASFAAFYGYNAESGTWDLSQRYTRFLQCYLPWVNALTPCLNDLINMNDGSAPSNPENLRVSSISPHYMTLNWDRSYDYDFDSYEIQLRMKIGEQWYLREYDRNTDASLARQNLSSFEITYNSGLDAIFYVRIRAKDKNGNYSPWSDEIKVYQPVQGGGSISAFTLSPENRRVKISFSSNITGATGYMIARRIGSSEMQLLSSWQHSPQLLPNPEGVYEFWDNNVPNNQVVRYQIGVMRASGEFWHHQILRTMAFKPISIVFQDLSNQATDTVKIGLNLFAQDGEDPLDQPKPSVSYYQVRLYSMTNNHPFELEVKQSYDLLTSAKCWNLRAINVYANQNLRIHLDADAASLPGQILIKNTQSGLWHDLRHADLSWVSSSPAANNFELWWGYQKPEIVFIEQNNQAVAAGSVIPLAWSIINPSRIQHAELWFTSLRDSIFISQIDPYQTQMLWQSPPEPKTGYHLMLKANMVDGNQLRKLSPQVWDFYPSHISLSAPGGNSLFGIPINGFSAQVDELFAPGTMLWQPSASDNWQYTTTIQGNQVYMISSPQPWQLSFGQAYAQQPVSISLNQGWNLIANPHFHSYRLSQMRFIYQEQSLSYQEALDAGLVQMRPYVLKQGGWSLTEQLDAGGVMLLDVNSSNPLSLVLDPGINPGPDINPPLRWGLELSAWDGLNSRDTVNLGIADIPAPLMNQIKPAQSPFQGIVMSLIPQTDISLQSMVQGLFPDWDQVTKSWNFKLVKQSEGPLGLKCQSPSLPQNYEVVITLGYQSLILVPNQMMWMDLDTGIHYGTISIRNYHSSVQMQRPSGSQIIATAYPNPFAHNLKIRLNSPKGTDVNAEVYNLRGQRILRIANANIPLQPEIVWDGKDERGQNLSRGVYLIRIRAGTAVQTLKVIYAGD